MQLLVVDLMIIVLLKVKYHGNVNEDLGIACLFILHHQQVKMCLYECL